MPRVVEVMPRVARMFLSAVSLLLVCLGAGSLSSASATVFRDRASFNAAAQNLRTIDFESAPPDFSRGSTIDGVYFQSISGLPMIVQGQNSSGKVLFAGSVGEITRMSIYLPPGTTAVGCDQFARPMIISTSTGESVTMNESDGSDFVGFVSGQPIESLTVFFDFPEPTPSAFIDNLSYGQGRAGNEPPAPLLLADASTGRAAALDSVTLTAEPFNVASSRTRNLSTDGLTRITLFLVGVRLDAPGDAALVNVRAEDARHGLFDLPVEATGGVKNLGWMAQVTVRLPEELSGAGDVSVSVSVRGVESNKATLHVN